MNTPRSFPRSSRLLRPAEFQAVFDHTGSKVGDANFLLLVRANGSDHPRLGLVVAKKKVRRSVDRNRLKRVVRDSFRLHQTALPAVDVIFMARNDLATLASADLHAALAQAWKRLRRKMDSSRPAGSGNEA